MEFGRFGQEKEERPGSQDSDRDFLLIGKFPGPVFKPLEPINLGISLIETAKRGTPTAYSASKGIYETTSAITKLVFEKI